jgi:predicted lysophospholipase L1 biosynthesis ABC-type transport system permease subunit
MELITPGFFRTIGMRVLDGRAFDWQDDERSRGVVIVNEALARRLSDDGRAIGRRIRLGAEPHRQDLEIVGVVNDARFGDYRSVPVPMAFRPRWQEPGLLRQPVVLVRSNLGSAEAERTLREVVASFRRESLTGTVSLETLIDRTMIEDRLMARLSLWFGGLALVLALTGVYAVLAHGFARRRREIGVRLALGARPSGIARIVLRQGLGTTLAGITLGVPLALVIGRAMESLLFDLSPLEPVTLALVAAACLAATMLAAAIPALRASRVDPVVVLQAE